MSGLSSLTLIVLNSISDYNTVKDSLENYRGFSCVHFINLNTGLELQKLQSEYGENISIQSQLNSQADITTDWVLVTDSRFLPESYGNLEYCLNSNEDIFMVNFLIKESSNYIDIGLSRYETVRLNIPASGIICKPFLMRKEVFSGITIKDFETAVIKRQKIPLSDLNFTLKTGQKLFSENRGLSRLTQEASVLAEKIDIFNGYEIKKTEARLADLHLRNNGLSGEYNELLKKYRFLSSEKKIVAEKIKLFNLTSRNRILINTEPFLETYFYKSLLFLLDELNDYDYVKSYLKELLALSPFSAPLLYCEFLVNYRLNNYFYCRKILSYLVTSLDNNAYIPEINVIPVQLTETDFYFFLAAVTSYKTGDYEAYLFYSGQIKEMEKYREALLRLKANISAQIVNIPVLLKNYDYNSNNKLPLAFISLRIAREYLHEIMFSQSLNFYRLACSSALSENNYEIFNLASSELMAWSKYLNISYTSENEPGAYSSYCLGKYYFSSGNFREAEKAFRQASEFINSQPGPYISETTELFVKEDINRLSELLSHVNADNFSGKELFVKRLSEASELYTEKGAGGKEFFNRLYQDLHALPVSDAVNYFIYVINGFLALIYYHEKETGRTMKHAREALHYFPQDLILESLAEILPANKCSAVIDNLFYRYQTLQSRTEFYELLKKIEKISPEIVIEIGTYEGGSFLALAAFIRRGGLIISIDEIKEDYREGLKKDLADINGSVRGHFISGDSHNPLSTVKLTEILKGLKADILFIDGDHSYEGVKKDFLMYRDFLKDDGLIVFHDIQSYPEQYGFKADLFWKELSFNRKTEEIIYNDVSPGIGIIKKSEVQGFLKQ